VSHQIITPRKSWIEKLKDGIAGSSPQVKQGLIAAASLFAVTILGTIGGCWKVSVENSQLNARLSATNELTHTQEAQLATLRHENQNLVVENSRYRTLMNPIERKAKELYPELETSAAVAKLAKDLDDTRNLATRGQFKPLSTELRGRIVDELKLIQPEMMAEKIKVSVACNAGNISRYKLAQELGEVLKESGLAADFRGSGDYMSENFETPVRVFVSSQGSPKLESLWKKTVQGISPFLNSGVVPIWNPATTNEIAFQIMGTPGFLPNGSVIFE
jgi:hypothetical protein